MKKLIIFGLASLGLVACAPKVVEPEGTVCRLAAAPIESAYEQDKLTLEERNSLISRCNTNFAHVK